MTQSLLLAVDETICNRCGLCQRDCPISIIEQDAAGNPFVDKTNEAACVLCQHCLAICPAGAITVSGLSPAGSLPILSDSLPSLEQMDRLIQARRSVRQYRNENVSRELIERLLRTLTHAPTGVNARELRFTVIDDRSTLARLRERAYAAISSAAAAGTIPPKAQLLQRAAERWAEDGRDMIFRHAPHLLLVSAPPTTPTPQQDVSITLSYFDLLAQAAGLGTVWCGYVRVLFETLPSLKTLVGLPVDHVYYAMLFGNPAVKYVRTAQREGNADVRRVTELVNA